MLGALLCVVVALGALAQAIESGLFVQHAVMAASHHVQGAGGGIVDVFCF